MTNPTNKPIHRAAAFVSGLDPRMATELFEKLTEEEARALRVAIAELGGPTETRPEPEPSSHVASGGGVELELSGATEMPAPATDLAPPQQESVGFDSLADSEPEVIASYLEKEHPRTIALVLTRLPGALASSVLDRLPEAEQPRLVTLMAQQGDADAEATETLARELVAWVREQEHRARLKAERAVRIRQMLAATPEPKRRRLVSEIVRSDPGMASLLGDLAREPQPVSPPSPTPTPPRPRPSIGYGDLDRLDDRALVEALAALDRRTALLALAEASNELLTRVESQLPRRARGDLKRELAKVGSTSLPEVDRAKEALLLSAERVMRRRRVSRSVAA